MPPTSNENQVVQVEKILRILREQDVPLLDRRGQMFRIGRAGLAHIRREPHGVPHPLELSDHSPIGDVVVQVEPHALDATCVGTYGGLSKPRRRISAMTSSRSCCNTSSLCRQ